MSEEVLGFSDDDRDLIRDSLRRLLTEQWPVLKALDMGADPKAVRGVWKQLADLSVPDLGRDPDMGGVREILLAFEEFGRACCPAPFLGAVIANLLAARGVVAPDGERRPAGAAPPLVAVGFGAFDGDMAAGEVSLSGDRISGSVNFIEGASSADRYILFVADPCGVAIVEAGVDGVDIQGTPALSLPALATVRLSNAPATFAPASADVLRDLVQIARLGCAARALGSAQRGYDLVVEHVSQRKQFGQLIGQFQAVQHRLVDNLTRLDAARLTLDAAATAHDQGLGSWSTFANLALAHLSPGLRQLAIDMHQLMGAIGYAEEHELPRHFRQIHGNLTRFGGVVRARAAIGDYLVRPGGQTA